MLICHNYAVKVGSVTQDVNLKASWMLASGLQGDELCNLANMHFFSAIDPLVERHRPTIA